VTALIVAVGGRWFPEPQGGGGSGLVALGVMVLAAGVTCLFLERLTIRSEIARWLEQVFGSTSDVDPVEERAGDEPEERS
jgi:hypothetical protein